MIKPFACDTIGLFQSPCCKMVRFIHGNMLTPQKMRPNQNRILMMFLNLMFYLDFTSCLFNQKDVITMIALEHSCPMLIKTQETFKLPWNVCKIQNFKDLKGRVPTLGCFSFFVVVVRLSHNEPSLRMAQWTKS